MKRAFLFGLIGLATLFSPGTSQAGWHEFWDRVHLDWHRNNAWPLPFTELDKQMTRVPFAAMSRNGWQMQNTLGDELFDRETQQLTRAGKLKVQWILTQTPQQRRTVYVLQGNSDRATQERLASVKQAIRNMYGLETNAESSVALIGTPPRNGSGDYLDRVRRSYEASTPAPRLPKMDDGGSGQ